MAQCVVCFGYIVYKSICYIGFLHWDPSVLDCVKCDVNHSFC